MWMLPMPAPGRLLLQPQRIRLDPAGHTLLLPLRGRLRLCCGEAERELRRGDVAFLSARDDLHIDLPRRAAVWLQPLPDSVSPEQALLWASGLHRQPALARALLGWVRRPQQGVNAAALLPLQAWCDAAPGRSSAQRMFRLRPLLAARLELQLRDLQPGDLDRIAERAALSRFHFSRVFHQVFGSSPIDFNRRSRLQHALDGLRLDARPLWAWAEQAGFSRSSSFARACRRQFGATPSMLRIAKLLPAR